MFCDRQSEAGTAGLARPRLIHAIKSLENAGQFLGGNTVARVLNSDIQSAVLSFSGNADLSSRLVVVNRIVDEIRQGSGKPCTIRLDLNRGAVHAEFNAAFNERILSRRNLFPDDNRQIELLRGECPLSNPERVFIELF